MPSDKDKKHDKKKKKKTKDSKKEKKKRKFEKIDREKGFDTTSDIAWLPKSLQTLNNGKQKKIDHMTELIKPLATGVQGGGRDTVMKAGKGWARTNANIAETDLSFECEELSTLEQLARKKSHVEDNSIA